MSLLDVFMARSVSSNAFTYRSSTSIWTPSVSTTTFPRSAGQNEGYRRYSRTCFAGAACRRVHSTSTTGEIWHSTNRDASRARASWHSCTTRPTICARRGSKMRCRSYKHVKCEACYILFWSTKPRHPKPAGHTTMRAEGRCRTGLPMPHSRTP